jgi:hypothetical protein
VSFCHHNLNSCQITRNYDEDEDADNEYGV